MNVIALDLVLRAGSTLVIKGGEKVMR